MSQSPSRFDVSSINSIQQCNCWRYHFLSLFCGQSVACFCLFRLFLPVSSMQVARQLQYLILSPRILYTAPCLSSSIVLQKHKKHFSQWLQQRSLTGHLREEEGKRKNRKIETSHTTTQTPVMKLTTRPPHVDPVDNVPATSLPLGWNFLVCDNFKLHPPPFYHFPDHVQGSNNVTVTKEYNLR